MKHAVPPASAFPVGYHRLHEDQFYNFTLNRWHSIGHARLEDMREAGKRIRVYDDWKTEMLRIAEQALSEDRLANAAICYRSAEFHTQPEDPDKDALYDRFAALFYQAFEGDEIQRVEVPYLGAFLPSIRLLPTGDKKGTILLHGGFDSFLEEWYLMMKWLAGQGYEVIGFEGPGQGAALIKAGLAFDYRWEKPTSAILDHFEVEEATLFGLSLGGWLCLRAAAFDSRIRRVVASGHAIDYLEMIPAAIRWMFRFFMRFEGVFNKSALWKMEMNPRMKWEIGNTMRVTKTATPLEGASLGLSLSRENMHVGRITQDVLLLSGAEHHFIPIKMHARQVGALVNARSVTERVFTSAESAQNHCQIGNIGLLLEVVAGWIGRVSQGTAVQPSRPAVQPSRPAAH